MDRDSSGGKQKSKTAGYSGLVSCIDSRIGGFYRWLRNSFAGRFFDAYGRADRAVFGQEGAVKPTFELRRRLAEKLGNRGVIGALSRLLAIIISCPLRVFGAFYFSCAIITVAMYFVTFIFNNIPMMAGTMFIPKSNLIVGGVMAAISIPLMFSTAPISIAVTQGRLGKILFGDSTHLPEQYRENTGKRKDTYLTVVLAVILGICAGYCTRFIGAVLIPTIVSFIPVIALVFVIPEIGAVFTVASIPVLAVVNRDGYFLTVAVLILWGAFLIKLLLGKRSFVFRLIDLFIAVLCVLIFAGGIGSAGGDNSLIISSKFAIILSAYFPLCNLLKYNEWGMRCIKTLGISFFFMGCLGVVSGFFGEFAVEWLNNGGFYEYAEAVGKINAVYSDSVMTSCMSILALPAMLPKLKNKRSVLNIALTVTAVSVLMLVIYFGGDARSWRAILWSMVIMMFMYSHRSVTAVIFGAVPVTCIAINADNVLEKLVKPMWIPVKQVISRLFDFGTGTTASMNAVLKMIAEHPLGVGMGSRAFGNIYANYAVSGFDKVTDAGSFWLELTAEIGVAGLVTTAAIVLMFIQLCVSSIRHIYNKQYAETVIMIVSAFIGILLYGLYAWIWRDIEVFSAFWCLVAIGVAIIRNGYDDSLHARNEQGSTFFKSDKTIE